MIKDGLTTNECDKCVYTKTVRNACIIVCVYADDMLILETNIEIIKFTKKMLSNSFDMKDLGVAVTPRFHGYGDVTATYIRKSEVPSRIYAKHQYRQESEYGSKWCIIHSNT